LVLLKFVHRLGNFEATAGHNAGFK